MAGGALVVQQRVIGYRDHACRAIDDESATCVVIQAVRDRIGRIGIGRIFTGVGDVLGKIALILIITVFILLEISGFSAKVRSAFPNADRSLKPIAEINDNVRRYLALKTLISLTTGVLVALWLRIIGTRVPSFDS